MWAKKTRWVTARRNPRLPFWIHSTTAGDGITRPAVVMSILEKLYSWNTLRLAARGVVRIPLPPPCINGLVKGISGDRVELAGGYISSIIVNLQT